MIALLRASPHLYLIIQTSGNSWWTEAVEDWGAKLEDTFSCGGGDPRRQQDGGARTETWL